MIQKIEINQRSNTSDDSYKKVVKRMHGLYNGTITEQEAHEAARNLIAFCKVLLEIKLRMNQNLKDDR